MRGAAHILHALCLHTEKELMTSSLGVLNLIFSGAVAAIILILGGFVEGLSLKLFASLWKMDRVSFRVDREWRALPLFPLGSRRGRGALPSPYV